MWMQRQDSDHSTPDEQSIPNQSSRFQTGSMALNEAHTPNQGNESACSTLLAALDTFYAYIESHHPNALSPITTTAAESTSFVWKRKKSAPSSSSLFGFPGGSSVDMSSSKDSLPDNSSTPQMIRQNSAGPHYRPPSSSSQISHENPGRSSIFANGAFTALSTSSKRKRPHGSSSGTNYINQHHKSLKVSTSLSSRLQKSLDMTERVVSPSGYAASPATTVDSIDSSSLDDDSTDRPFFAVAANQLPFYSNSSSDSNMDEDQSMNQERTVTPSQQQYASESIYRPFAHHNTPASIRSDLAIKSATARHNSLVDVHLPSQPLSAPLPSNSSLPQDISYHDMNGTISNDDRSESPQHLIQAQWETRLTLMAEKKGILLSDMVQQWHEKKKELENNLMLISNGVPSDSFQDMELIGKRIIETATWLSDGHLEDLEMWIPKWKLLQPTIENLMLYLQVIHDIQNTIKHPPHTIIANVLYPSPSQDKASMMTDMPSLMTESFPRVVTSYLDALNELITNKRILYGNVFKDGGIAWKVLGFPVMEASGTLRQFSQWLFSLVACFFGLLQLNRNNTSKLGCLQPSTPNEILTLVVPTLQMLVDVADLLSSISPIPDSLCIASQVLVASYVKVMIYDLNGKTKSLASANRMDIADGTPKPMHSKSHISNAKLVHFYDQAINAMSLLLQIQRKSTSEVQFRSNQAAVSAWNQVTSIQGSSGAWSGNPVSTSKEDSDYLTHGLMEKAFSTLPADWLPSPNCFWLQLLERDAFDPSQLSQVLLEGGLFLAETGMSPQQQQLASPAAVAAWNAGQDVILLELLCRWTHLTACLLGHPDENERNRIAYLYQRVCSPST